MSQLNEESSISLATEGYMTKKSTDSLASWNQNIILHTIEVFKDHFRFSEGMPIDLASALKTFKAS